MTAALVALLGAGTASVATPIVAEKRVEASTIATAHVGGPHLVEFVVDAWVEKYNTMRVHRSLGGQTPAGYAKMLQEAAQYDLGGGSR